MVPVKTNQNWLPSIFNDSFDNGMDGKSKRYGSSHQCD